MAIYKLTCTHNISMLGVSVITNHEEYMYETDLDYQPLKKNIKPWGQSQMNSWRLYELNRHKPGYIKHGNYWNAFEKNNITQDRMTDWDIPAIMGHGSTFGLQPQMNTSRPKVSHIHEMNIYCDDSLDLHKTNKYIVDQTGDNKLSVDVHNALKEFLEPMGWEKLRYSRFQQPAGEMTSSHVDVHRQMSNLHNSLDDPILSGEVRIGVLFLDDWAYGQGFGMGESIAQNWKKGDFYEWPWFFPHHTFNNSNVERNSLTIIGRKRLPKQS